MRWEPGPGGGFCPPEVEPWLPLDDGTSGIDVATQRADPGSILHLTRSLLALRRERPALAAGGYASLEAPDGCYAYRRSTASESLVVALDLGGAGGRVELPAAGRILLATHRDRAGEGVPDQVELAPFEGVVVELGTTAEGSSAEPGG